MCFSLFHLQVEKNVGSVLSHFTALAPPATGGPRDHYYIRWAPKLHRLLVNFDPCSAVQIPIVPGEKTGIKHPPETIVLRGLKACLGPYTGDVLWCFNIREIRYTPAGYDPLLGPRDSCFSGLPLFCLPPALGSTHTW